MNEYIQKNEKSKVMSDSDCLDLVLLCTTTSKQFSELEEDQKGQIVVFLLKASDNLPDE